MQVLMLICSIVSLIMSVIALIVGCISISIFVGLKNSTHKIEWRPIEDPYKNSEEDIEEFNEDPITGV